MAQNIQLDQNGWRQNISKKWPVPADRTHRAREKKQPFFRRVYAEKWLQVSSLLARCLMRARVRERPALQLQ